MEDTDIVRLYLDRSEDAIRCTAEKYGTRLRAVAYGMIADAQISEECENDTYLEAWQLIPPNEPFSYFYAFLLRIVRHIALDRCRRRDAVKRSAYLVELDAELCQCLPGGEEVGGIVDGKLLGELVSRFLRTVGKEPRIFFVRRYFFLDTVQEIAKRCGVSESKVKTSLFRTRAALRDALNKEGYVL